jgi:uncharacterized protein (DUF1330 family)
MAEPLTLCVLLWAHPGAEEALTAYEDQVLSLVPDYGGKVISRARSSGAGGYPREVHLLEFPSPQALDAYTADSRRQALAGDRDRAIARTEVIEVDLI